MNKYLVGIDEGTTGTKTCVFDIQGKLIAGSYCEYPSYYPGTGYVEQDVTQITEAIFSTCRDAIAKSRIDPKDILAVSLSTQGAACILLDENEAVVRNRMIGWQDLRGAEVTEEIKDKITDDEHYAIAGAAIGAFNTGVNVWLQKYEPETWKKVAYCCTNQDFFLRQLGADGYYVDVA